MLFQKSHTDIVMDRSNLVFSFFQCAGCLLLNEESSVGIHIQFVMCAACLMAV